MKSVYKSLMKKILIAAPHLTKPILNGADLYIEKKWGAINVETYEVTLVAADGIYILDKSNEWICTHNYPDTRRSQNLARLFHLFAVSEYLVSRYHTRAYQRHLDKFKLIPFYVVIASFASTYSLISGFNCKKIVVETHNYDPKLYRDRASELFGLKKYIALRNSSRSKKTLETIPKSVTMIALGVEDKKHFESFGFLRVLQSSIGYQSKPLRTTWPDADTTVISFVGSLSASMNEMALRHFFENDYEVLKSLLNKKLVVNVIGSDPSDEFSKYLFEYGVKLFPNVSDSVLENTLQKSVATFLPFKNNNGVKLKFATSASLGVPVVSFISPPDELQASSAIFYSDSIESWASFLNDISLDRNKMISICHAMQDMTKELSWSSVVTKEIEQIIELGGNDE